ncbi:MAG: DUF1624 domain-containing protein [Methanomassiliicoccales archaeon]|nr:DUF1624 domain-containing protein [Methanomassiliicoccales archaeon]
MSLPEKPVSRERYWEIDFLRGTAVTMMIVFHIIFDLNFLGIYRIQVYSGWLGLFAYSIGTLFLLLVGVSLTLSFRRAKKHLDRIQLRWKYLKRGLMIFGLGLVITAVTLIYPGRGFVIFGVLHCIGLSIILSYPLLPYRRLNLLFGGTIVIAGAIISWYTFATPTFVWLGFVPPDFYSIDYFPLLPWFGVVLIGVSLGNTLYQNHRGMIGEGSIKRILPVRSFCYLGRHSLVIYLLHQPIILALLSPFASSIWSLTP